MMLYLSPKRIFSSLLNSSFSEPVHERITWQGSLLWKFRFGQSDSRSAFAVFTICGQRSLFQARCTSQMCLYNDSSRSSPRGVHSFFQAISNDSAARIDLSRSMSCTLAYPAEPMSVLRTSKFDWSDRATRINDTVSVTVDWQWLQVSIKAMARTTPSLTLPFLHDAE